MRLSFISGETLLSRSSGLPPGRSGEQPLKTGIHDLATRRWCATACRHAPRWALTPPFHPYLIDDTRRRGGCFLSPEPYGHP